MFGDLGSETGNCLFDRDHKMCLTAVGTQKHSKPRKSYCCSVCQKDEMFRFPTIGRYW
jgi:hypothetical protein